jgi:hypothetical protein
MEGAGFPSPPTVANFLLKSELAPDAVVVVDIEHYPTSLHLDTIPLRW